METHQLQSIRSLHNARRQLVFKMKFAILVTVFEVVVRRPAIHAVRYFCQRQIMGGHQTDGVPRDQAAHHRFGTDTPVMRVGAGQQFVRAETVPALPCG